MNAANKNDPHGSSAEERMAKYAQAAKDRKLVFNGHHLPYYRGLVIYARQLRSSLTTCEKRVAGFLKSRGIPFRAQHPIDYYIVDFYLHDHHLVIEIDGEQHTRPEGKDYDEYRDGIMEMYELRTLRIKNRDITTNSNQAFQRILDAVNCASY